jgi:D-cysteine desulfhydrase
MARLGQEYGINLYLKRDDLTGILTSGNKIRKLEFLVREALDRQCDTLVTCGALQSNHARATAAVAARVGLKCLLVLRGDPQEVFQGNILLDRLLGADIFYVTPEEYQQIDAVFASIDQRLRKSGRNPYLIPEGGSNALGAFGYVAAVEELYHQIKAQGLRVDSVVCAMGSGGTCAGLLLGKKLLGLPAEIYGINVGETAEYFQTRILEIIEKAIKLYRLPVEVKKEEIQIIDGYVGLGYGQSQIQELELIRDVARKEGIILDPVYTGKAMYGLLDQIRKQPKRFGQNVLFLHTGGIFSLFGISKEFSRIL